MVRETKIVVIHNLIRISRSTPASTVSFEYTWAVENFNGLSPLHRYLLTRYYMFDFFFLSFFFSKEKRVWCACEVYKNNWNLIIMNNLKKEKYKKKMATLERKTLIYFQNMENEKHHNFTWCSFIRPSTALYDMIRLYM